MHLGVILPNYGSDANPDAIRRSTELAEELGYDSVWATEHVIVGPEAVDPYGRVYAPLATLAWLAGLTERIGLGTSIVLVPLHHPIHLAKETATLQELSRGRFTLGVGMGWHRDEFDYMGAAFEGRGRRADEALRLVRALWSGETSFHGDHWSFEGATFGPLPSPVPEIWVGGSSERALRRALEVGDVWHTSRGVEPERIREVKAEHAELRIVARTQVPRAEEYLDAGVDGLLLSFESEEEMRAAVARYR